jgi:UDP-glucose 4-epimerase
MKVLCTGGLGYIGSHVVDKLIAADHKVLIVDNMSSNAVTLADLTPSKKYPVLHMNCSIADLTKEDLIGVEAVVHCAATADVHGNWDNIANRAKLVYNNFVETAWLLEVVPPVPFIFTSTCAVYGSKYNLKTDGYDEDALPYIQSPYAATKLGCEAIIQAWGFKTKAPFFNLRLVSNVGSRYTHGHIVDFIKMAFTSGRIKTKDNGIYPKSMCHVEDTADFILACLGLEESTSGVIPRGTYNVSSNEAWTWRGTVNVMEEMRSSPYCSYHLQIEAPFSKVEGSIGDPVGLIVTTNDSNDIYRCKRSVKQGVIEALEWNGWGRK